MGNCMKKPPAPAAPPAEWPKMNPMTVYLASGIGMTPIEALGGPPFPPDARDYKKPIVKRQ